MNAFDIAESRFEEAREITDALRDRMGSLRRELRDTRALGGDALAVIRRMRSTSLEVQDAEAYEARCFREFSAEHAAALHASVGPPRKRQNVA